jgi:CelD/BcsL family acetyltransferase involved in cellulose biosynthesis
MNDRWQFDWLTTWDDIKSPEFSARWQRFADEAFTSHVFFHPALGWAWLDTYLPLRDLRPCFLIGRRGQHTAFLPLVLWRKNWKNAFQRVLVPVGYSDYDYHDPLVIGPAETMDWAGFWTGLHENLTLRSPCQFDRFELGGVKAEHTEGAVAWEDDERCPNIDLSPFQNVEQYLATLSKRLQGDLGRRMRRLMEEGSVTCRAYGRKEAAEATAALTPFLRHHAARWPNAYRAPRFHELLIQRGLPAGLTYFSELRLNQVTLSWRLAFTWKSRYYSYIPVVNPAHARRSPGKLHQLECITACFALGLRIFDHLRGAEAYKNDWANGETRLKRAAWSRSSAVSSLRNAWVDHGKQGLARLVNDRASDVQPVQA